VIDGKEVNMPVIRPVSDLRNKTPEIEEICVKENRPVFITKNGTGHLVVMSQKLFEQQQALLDLYEKLDEAEEQSKAGMTRPFRKAISDLKARIHAKGKISD
jgi:prevent-host-death family protein